MLNVLIGLIGLGLVVFSTNSDISSPQRQTA
jgi:hypothetical protein